MTPRLAALVKRWLNSVTSIFGHATTPKSLLFSKFALLVDGTSRHMNARGSTIQVASLLTVRSLTLFIAADDLILLI
jgi:hypothetical protein